MLKREWGRLLKATGNYRTYSSLVKLPEFQVGNLPLGRTAALVPEFAVCPWAEHSDDDDDVTILDISQGNKM